MNSNVRSMLAEIDALAEQWDDHGAFDRLGDDTKRAEPMQSPSVRRRGARWLNRANVWWVPLTASIVVLLIAWQRADRAAEFERLTAAASQALIDEKEAWQELQKARIQKSRDRLRETMGSDDYEETLQLMIVLRSLGGWGDDTATPDAQTIDLVEHSGKELASRLREAADAIETGMLFSVPGDSDHIKED